VRQEKESLNKQIEEMEYGMLVIFYTYLPLVKLIDSLILQEKDKTIEILKKKYAENINNFREQLQHTIDVLKLNKSTFFLTFFSCFSIQENSKLHLMLEAECAAHMLTQQKLQSQEDVQIIFQLYHCSLLL